MITRAFIFPTFNESETIGILLNQLMPHLNSDEIIVVADDSYGMEREQTLAVLARYPKVVFLDGETKGGRGYAVWRAMGLIARDYPQITHIIEADCDGSHRVVDILKVSEMDENLDFVIGSRYLSESRIEGWSISRRILSKFLNLIIPKLLSLRISDITNGLRRYSIASASMFLTSAPRTKGFIYLSEQALILGKGNYHPYEYPIVFVARIAGASSVGIRDLIKSTLGLVQIVYLKLIDRLK